MRQLWIARTVFTGILSFVASVGFAVPCEKDMSFEEWRRDVVRDAVSQGISRSVVNRAASKMTYDREVIRRDRAQSVFQQSFLQFSDRMASQNRITKGRAMLKTHKNLFDRIEREYGVPASVLVTYWGLESDFGTGGSGGKFHVITSMTTLAYDCRRAEFFRQELFDALRLIEGGDVGIDDMTGAWAGELGPMQFTPSDYYNYAVDFDGDGRRDVMRSIPDMMASSANFLKQLGFQRGEPWLEEVRLPNSMPWEEADLEILHTRAQWARWGVKRPDGRLERDEKRASLLLPMGRLGPAFLAYPSFKAFTGWNAAMVYSITAAYLATRIEGAPALGRGNGVVQVLNHQQITELQKLLEREGFPVGKIDGKLGAMTRAAIKKGQLLVKLPADSYPTVELIERLKARRR